MDAVEAKILGMPIVADNDSLITNIQPLCGMVIVKGLDEDGDIRYAEGSTTDLLLTEALGMARRLVLRIEKALMAEDT